MAIYMLALFAVAAATGLLFSRNAFCAHVCPAKNKKDPSRKALNMVFQPPIREQENENWNSLTLKRMRRVKQTTPACCLYRRNCESR